MGGRSPIRAAGFDDLAGFVQLGLRFYREEGGRHADPTELARFAAAHLSSVDRAFFVAEQGRPSASLSPAISPCGYGDAIGQSRKNEIAAEGRGEGGCMAGFICGLIAPHYLTGEPTAFKTAWYVVPGARGYGAALLRAFETWALARGARRLIVAGRTPRTLALLARRHFTPLETVYAKDLPWQKQPFPSS